MCVREVVRWHLGHVVYKKAIRNCSHGEGEEMLLAEAKREAYFQSGYTRTVGKNAK